MSKMQDRARRYLDSKWGLGGWSWLGGDDDGWEARGWDDVWPTRPMDMNFVAADLVVGSAIGSEAGVARLKEIGVADVICCAEEWNAPDAKLLAPSGIGLLAIGMNDDFQVKPASWFKAGIDYARRVTIQDGRLYVHCNMGINRAPSMAYAILRSRGLTVGEARASMMARPRPAGYGADNPYYASAEAAIASL